MRDFRGDRMLEKGTIWGRATAENVRESHLDHTWLLIVSKDYYSDEVLLSVYLKSFLLLSKSTF
jgi:hypothetical protein